MNNRSCKQCKHGDDTSWRDSVTLKHELRINIFVENCANARHMEIKGLEFQVLNLGVGCYVALIT